jgi:hypothetical protein
MIELTKVPNGVIYLGQELAFTSVNIPGGHVYDGKTDMFPIVELNEAAYQFPVDSTSIDGVVYTNGDDFITALYA